jgi:hypothetical protein
MTTMTYVFPTATIRVREYIAEASTKRLLAQVILHDDKRLTGVAFDWGGDLYIDYAPCAPNTVAEVAPWSLPYTDTLVTREWRTGSPNLPFDALAFAEYLSRLDGDDIDAIVASVAEAATVRY